MIYADYVYYSNEFAGTSVPADSFFSLAPEVCREIDRLTLDRARHYITNKVKNAVCAGIEALYSARQKTANIPIGIKSESNDGVSVTYADQDLERRQQTERNVLIAAIKKELTGSGLLYRGC